MKPFYTLVEVARMLNLNHRAEVEDVLKQILAPNDGKPILTVSVNFYINHQFVYRGKFRNRDYWNPNDKRIVRKNLTGLFDIHVFRHTPMEMILNGGDARCPLWPDEKGSYPLNSQRPKGLVVILVQNGLAYELQDEVSISESRLVIAGENLKLYAEQQGITLRGEPSPKEMEGEKEPYAQEEAAALVGVNSDTILEMLTSRGPVSRRLTPYIFVAEKRATSVREGREVVLNGFYSVEGIQYATYVTEEYVLSFGGSSRLLLHKGQDTFFLREEVRKKKKDLFVSAEDVDQWVADIKRNTPPIQSDTIQSAPVTEAARTLKAQQTAELDKQIAVVCSEIKKAVETQLSTGGKERVINHARFVEETGFNPGKDKARAMKLVREYIKSDEAGIKYHGFAYTLRPVKKGSPYFLIE